MRELYKTHHILVLQTTMKYFQFEICNLKKHLSRKGYNLVFIYAFGKEQ